MYKAERNQIRASLNGWIDEKKIVEDKPIVVFGAADYAREDIDYLRSKGFNVELVIDNDSRKQGKWFRGVRVISPDSLPHEMINEAVFIICSIFRQEMCHQLNDMGVRKEQICIIVLSSFHESLVDNIKLLYKGKKIYKKLSKMPGGENILVCPYTGTGDIYLIGTLLQQYLEKKDIEDYLFVVVNVPCAMVADIFDIKNVVRIEGPEACSALMKYYLVCPDECNITVLNDGWADVYTNPVENIRGLHGMHFTEMFRRFVFDLDNNVKPIHPIFKDVSAEVDRIFQDNCLQEKNTVILAPYSTTLADMPGAFWNELVGWLKDQGFVVCTNCGSPDEKAIQGTIPLFFPLNIAPQLISKAGFFIGIRSGFCDVVSGSDAVKIILYDKSNFFFNCSAFDYFSLEKMQLCNDAIELEYDNIDIQPVICEIKKILKH